MIQNYTAEEMSEILGIPAKRIMDYGYIGVIPYGRECGANMYYLSSIEDILKEEINLEENKQRIIQEGNSYIIKKDSLEKLLKTIEDMRPDVFYVKIRKPRPNKGSGDYTGEIQYFLKPTEKVKISYEQNYNIDNINEVDEIKKDIKEDLENMLTQKEIETKVKIF